jgi:RNA polymerase sigma factor (sigma-70 family)
MADSPLAGVLRYLRRAAGNDRADEPSDGRLLGQFVARRDEAAFAALLRRHGPLVLAVCRQLVGDAHEAEDAFQATFLVLARRATSVRRQDSVAAWLHRVALNVARTVRSRAARRKALQRRAALMTRTDRAPEAPASDWQPVLHEEVDRLPGKYRAPVVLCYLQGKTHDEAARELGWPVGTVKGRLARARDLLHARLTRRGLTLSAGALAALSGAAAEAAVPAPLAGATVTAAALFAAGNLKAGTAPAAAVLAEGVLRAMTNTRRKVAAAVLLALLVAAGGAGWGYRIWGGEAPANPAPARIGDEKVVGKEPAREAPADDDFGDEVKGLRAKVSLAKRKFAAGEPIEVKYVVKNVSKEEQTLWHSGFWANHQVLVNDADGKEPPLTEFGEERRKAFSPGGVRKKNSPVEVPAGGEDAAYEKYDLTKLFDLSKPGRYTVRYVYEEKQGGWEGRLPSNEAAFEVTAKDEKKRDEKAEKAPPGAELKPGQKREGEISKQTNEGNPGGEGHLYGYRAVVPITLKAGANVSASVIVVGKNRTAGLMLKDPTGKILGSSMMVSGAARISVEEVNATGRYTIEVYSDRIGPYTLLTADTTDELDRKALEDKIDQLEKELAALRKQLEAKGRKKP